MDTETKRFLTSSSSNNNNNNSNEHKDLVERLVVVLDALKTFVLPPAGESNLWYQIIWHANFYDYDTTVGMTPSVSLWKTKIYF